MTINNISTLDYKVDENTLTVIYDGSLSDVEQTNGRPLEVRTQTGDLVEVLNGWNLQEIKFDYASKNIVAKYYRNLVEDRFVEIENAIDDIQPIVDAMRTEIISPSDKIGFDWKVYYIGTVEYMREYIESTTPPANDGTDYLKPITYTAGMEVTTGLWYTDGADTWECIQSGIPADFTDTAYFDIIVA